MTKDLQEPCWAELVAGESGSVDYTERSRVLDHVAGCPQCRRALDAIEPPVVAVSSPHALDPAGAAAIRARLIARASSDRHIARSRRIDLPAASGWLTAAALGTLLLTHHTFHRPVLGGWVVASFLAMLCFGLVLQIFAQRRAMAELRERLAQARAERERVRQEAG